MPARKSIPRSSMRATEAATWRWLLTSEGYTPETLTFSRLATPCFRGADDRSWEPKLSRNAVIVFTPAQVAHIRSLTKCSVVVWDGGKVPAAIIPASAIPEDGGHWKQYLLHVAGTRVLAGKKGTGK